MTVMRISRRKFIMAVLLVIAAFLVFWYLGKPADVPMSYQAFSEHVRQGDVESARLKEKTVSFRLKGDAAHYRVENPLAPDFKEKLLLSGVRVEDETGRDPLSYGMDMAFNVLFFALVLFGLFKLLSMYHRTFRVVRHTGFSFAQIAGMEDVKQDMWYAVDILKNPKQYAAKGIRQNKGVILEGLPGNGKTLFAKALAQEAGVNFIATKGADFQSALMSMGAMKIRMLFAKARRHKPCIVFIDEFDSIGERRNYAGTGIDKENNRIITTMLNEMDGFSSTDGIMVVAATNSYASLDPALIRPGRFDLKFTIGNPDRQTRLELIKLYAGAKKLSPEVTGEGLAAAFDGLSCAAIETILNEASTIASMHGREAMTMDDVVVAARKANCKLNVSLRR